jgi:ectoine hydroxylase-related dioxygenase (phytanoyl-CoA dioxygenase family)
MSVYDDQRAAFAERGFLRLSSVFGVSSAAAMAGSIWAALFEKYRIRPDDPATWTVRQPTGFQALTRAGAFNAVAGPRVIAAFDDLLGKGQWSSTEEWGAPLITFPEPGRAWNVPQSQWHLDFPARGPTSHLPGVRLLAFIDVVEATGGGTVVVTGSHRLVERLVLNGQAGNGRSADVRERLAATQPWFRALWSRTRDEPNRIERFMLDGACIDGVHVCVEELYGATGDVILMHPWMFHAPAPNCGPTPRFMISHSVFRKAGGR